mmetsp:Transcript_8725/g.21992  ORF Transcript_8725/g.21992 Transcript_8725/m.21992 type:complete len:359 (-) Transcript_8725:33-1109(-)|eukprot:CAMPEP_0177651026 /NCGR_PEP_ID=MMETSP0447-20121125/12292_1 /TAXON_ID=0 /ORGANISM="Stygamoeba regulata, Strain BSH-02190019" /LENGTH=358 /DNA_ID=CAMNT_0019154007 /DNA_START=208 /DNA_END=1284 /DNA_ORIENTATION=-
MGNQCGGSVAGSKDDQGVSRKIEEELRKDRKKMSMEVKLLLLGAGESGKSTLAKQMKIIHLKGFSEEERMPYKEIVHSNVIMSMRAIVLASQTERFSGVQFQPSNQANIQMFASNSILFDQEVNSAIATAVTQLWADEGIRFIYNNSSAFQLNDSSAYFFENIDRLAEPDYCPSEQDVLRARARTTGISELLFTVGDVRFRMVDVGGQRSERKKWIHCFQDVTGIIFFVAMSEYDLKLYEDDKVNRMHESLMLFEEICNCQWFEDKALILFLNKKDLFAQKIQTMDLNVCFPDYTGGCNYDAASEYIKQRFMKCCKKKDRKIYSHITCATDTSNIRFVFASVRDIIYQHSLRGCGFEK